MLSHTLTCLLAATALTSANPLTKRALAFDDVLVIGDDGTTTVVKDYEWDQLKARDDALLARPSPRASKQASQAGPARRGCEQSSEVQVLSDTTFLNWDVVMSSVVSAQGGDATVSISSGYSISNSLTVGSSLTSGLEGVMSSSLSLEYSESWTTDQSASYQFTVPSGQYGVIVSEPRVRRVEGNYLTGCTDSWDKNGFMSDTYTSQAYGNLNWVTGAIRLCNSSSYPIPYCIGTGSHY